MTPEERAAEWMGSPYTADEREANARLAALFCAAENDALEAAAQKADGMPRGASFSDEYEDGHDQACDRIAEAIRAMKHGTVSS